MSGNVWVWCRDVCTPDVSSMPVNGTPYAGPGDQRVLRGGCFHNWAVHCTVSNGTKSSTIITTVASAFASCSQAQSNRSKFARQSRSLAGFRISALEIQAKTLAFIQWERKRGERAADAEGPMPYANPLVILHDDRTVGNSIKRS